MNKFLTKSELDIFLEKLALEVLTELEKQRFGTLLKRLKITIDK